MVTVDQMKNDLEKKVLFEAVKTLVEMEETPHIHLEQHKLFNLFSIAFQYMLFRSTKLPGAYIIRIEDSYLADKLAKRSKDPSTRKFMHSLLLPRKLKYGSSVFYLDFFHMASWNLTNELAREKIKGALVVKNTSTRPMNELTSLEQEQLSQIQNDYYFTSLQEFVPKVLVIAYGQQFPNVHQLAFPFIKKEPERLLAGVTISKNIKLNHILD